MKAPGTLVSGRKVGKKASDLSWKGRVGTFQGLSLQACRFPETF